MLADMSRHGLKRRIMQGGILTVLALGTACAPSSGTVITVEPSALSGPAVEIEASASAIRVNDAARAAVRVKNIVNLVAYEAHLSFDPNVLEVIELIDGGFVSPDFVVQNTFDNAAGTIDYAVAQIDQPPASGSGTLFEIVFRAKAQGQSPILFRETQAALAGALLADPDGMEIQVSLINGSISVNK